MATHFGKRIKTIRERIGLDRCGFGQVLSLSEDEVFAIEAGELTIPLDGLTKIAKNWPEYSTYLLTGDTDVKQRNPEIEIVARGLLTVGRA